MWKILFLRGLGHGNCSLWNDEIFENRFHPIIYWQILFFKNFNIKVEIFEIQGFSARKYFNIMQFSFLNSYLYYYTTLFSSSSWTFTFTKSNFPYNGGFSRSYTKSNAAINTFHIHTNDTFAKNFWMHASFLVSEWLTCLFYESWVMNHNLWLWSRNTPIQYIRDGRTMFRLLSLRMYNKFMRYANYTSN